MDQQETITIRQHTAEEEIEKIAARTQHLSPSHKQLIKEKIDRLVYMSKHADQPLTYINIYSQLKKRYRVAKYDEVNDEQFAQLMEFLDTLSHPDTAQHRLF